MRSGAPTWGRVRSELRRPLYSGTLGRRVALALTEAILRRNARKGSRFYFLGTWKELFARLGVEQPSSKVALVALRLLASLTSLVQRKGLHAQQGRGQTWIAAGDGRDLPDATEESPSEKRNPRRGPERTDLPRIAAGSAGVSSHRGRMRTPDLEQQRRWGRRPASHEARQLAVAVERCGAVPRGRLVEVSLTAPDGEDLAGRIRMLAGFFEGPGSGAVLVPELSPAGRLHYHGFVIGEVEAVRAAWRLCGGGQASIKAVRPGDHCRARYWASYCVKGTADDHEIVAAGVLADWRGPPTGNPPTAPETSSAADTPSPLEGAEPLSIASGPAPSPKRRESSGQPLPGEAPAAPQQAPRGLRRVLAGASSGLRRIVQHCRLLLIGARRQWLDPP